MHDGQSCVQVGIVAEHVLHNIIVELVVDKQRVIGLEVDICTVLVVGGFCGVCHQLTFFKGSLAHLSVTIGVYLEVAAQRVDGFHTDTIQTDRLLKGFRVVLTTRVQHADGFNHLTLRDASAIVAHRDAEVVVHINLNAVASLHLELVDRVVDNFLQQHVDTVFCQ